MRSNATRTGAYLVLAIIVISLLASATMAAPTVRDVSAAPSTVGIYEKYEIRFNVDTVATNPYWPYDTAPNKGVPAGVGVSVDGLFSNDNWATTIVQPGFLYQNFTRGNQLMSTIKKDWLYPQGNLVWLVRFAPTALGNWQFKVRVTDSSGTTTYTSPSNAFTCGPSTNHGFVRVSPKDHRYFETSDGAYLNFLGLSDYTTCTYEMDTLYATYKQNGINLVRPWWQGSQGPVLFGISGQGGVPDWRNLAITADAARPGESFSARIVGNYTVWTCVNVKPSTTYRCTAWVKTVGVTGSGDYGVYLQAFNCTTPDVPLTQMLRGDTDWTQLTAKITTHPNQYALEYLKITMNNTTGGKAYFADVSMREDLGNGQYGPELMNRPNFDAFKYVSQREAYTADYQVECAKRNNVYLKVCLQEKADVVFGCIQPDGTMGPQDDSNVYASDTHASRTYQSYLWRYIIARYGYATSIHSFELCNEGDPFGVSHWSGAGAMAKYFQTNDPNRHCAITSFWHSLPTKEFWSNPTYPDLKYVDWHQYIGQQNGNNLQYYYGWQEPITFSSTCKSAPNSLYINNPTGVETYTMTYPFAITPGHTYTVKCYMKGQNLTATGSQAGSPTWIYPTIRVTFKDGWWASDLFSLYPGAPNTFMGTYDWKAWSGTVTAPATARYMVLTPMAHWAAGEIWFDDITLHDDTTNENLEVPNGNLDANRLDYDTALMTYSIGTQIGVKSSRAVAKPVIRGENGISGNKVNGDTYKGSMFVGENQQLVDDTQGVWYHKFIWGQINPFGVIDMYWWRDNIIKNGLYRHARAYQAFMAGIPLSNGNYADARATTSSPTLRAWGQKDVVSNKAHLWIDNAPYTWKSVVDGTTIPPISGTVTLSGLKSGTYKAEWWDTTTGAITRTDIVTCANGAISLPVQGLVSDTACKIYSAAPDIDLRITTSSTTPTPGQIVTITVEAANSGDIDAANVVLSSRVPVEMDYVAGSAEAQGGIWNSGTGNVSWTVASVAAHATVTRTYRAKVK